MTRYAHSVRQTSKCGNARPPADGAEVLHVVEAGQEGQLVGRQRHLAEDRLVAVDAVVPGLQRADRALDPAPAVDAADPLQDDVGRAQLEDDGLRGVRRLREVVQPLRPLERAVDDLLGVVHHDLDQLLRVEGALLHQHRAQALALADAAAGLDVLVEGDAAAAQEQLAQPVVLARRGREDQAAVLDAHASSPRPCG